MNKNIVIAGLVCSNLVTLVALVFMCLMKWNEPARLPATTNAAPSRAADEGAQEFTFTAPGHFAGAGAPLIANRALTITATFDSQDTDGVIVAQGGLGHGYALYVQDGELWFAYRRVSGLTTVSGGKAGAGRHTAVATVSKAGELSLARDGGTPATADATGIITAQPTDGLDIGADRGAPVGPYRVPNIFGGTIESVSLKTAP